MRANLGRLVAVLMLVVGMAGSASAELVTYAFTAVDATGMHALEEFYLKCRRQGTTLLLAGVHAQPMFALARYGLLDKVGEANMFGNIDDALDRARAIVGAAPVPHPSDAQPEVARERRD